MPGNLKFAQCQTIYFCSIARIPICFIARLPLVSAVPGCTSWQPLEWPHVTWLSGCQSVRPKVTLLYSLDKAGICPGPGQQYSSKNSSGRITRYCLTDDSRLLVWYFTQGAIHDMLENYTWESVFKAGKVF